MERKTGYAYDEKFTRYYQNDNETPDRVKWINRQIETQGLDKLCKSIEPITNPMEYIQKIHTQEYIDYINTIPVSSVGGATEKIGDIAVLAVGYALGAVRDVCEGKAKNAFCNLRPPGHHVVNSGPTGYCVYANVVIAAQYAREEYGLERIAIIDWDCHHGNGTVEFLCLDTNILFLEFGFSDIPYEECNIEWNHILSKGVPGNKENDDYLATWNTFIPAFERFKPELIIISSGFDLKKGDPVCGGGLNVTAKGVSQLTRLVMGVADTYCNGRLVSVLEGGYRDELVSSEYWGLAECAENHLKTLLTGQVQPETPFFLNSAIKQNPAPSLFDLQKRSLNTTLSILQTNNARILDIRGREIISIKKIKSSSPFSSGVYLLEWINPRGNQMLIPFVHQ